MAIVTISFPVLKTDKASLAEAERLHPLIVQKMSNPNPGLLKAFRGWVLYEDDRYVRDEYKEALIFEWLDQTSFNSWLGSDQFTEFIGLVQPLLAGMPTLELYETNNSPKDAVVAPVIEVIRVSVADDESVKAAEQVWTDVSQFLLTKGQDEQGVAVTYGKSLNLEGCTMMVGIIGWTSTEQQSKVSQETAFIKSIDTLRSLGEVSRIVVDVAPLILPPLERAS